MVKFLRWLTGRYVYPKRLPSGFGSNRIYVTSRSDIRLLAPGLERSGGDLFRVVNDYVEEGNTVWDIGSNLGILTFASADKVGVKGRVYSLEADPQYAAIQTRTQCSLPEGTGRVSILCAAVAGSSAILDLIIPRKGHARNHLSSVSGNSAGEAEMTKQVVTLTLDWLLDYWDAPDFMKVDVEGAEVLALSGAKKLLREIRPIIYIECSQDNSKKLTEIFKDASYSLFSINEQGKVSEIAECVFNTLAKPK